MQSAHGRSGAKACDSAVTENRHEQDSDVVCNIWPKLVDPPALSDSEPSLKRVLPASLAGLGGHNHIRIAKTIQILFAMHQNVKPDSVDALRAHESVPGNDSDEASACSHSV